MVEVVIDRIAAAMAAPAAAQGLDDLDDDALNAAMDQVEAAQGLGGGI